MPGAAGRVKIFPARYGKGYCVQTGVFRVPGEFKDEDKWFRYFTKKQAAVLVASLLVDYRLVMAASPKGLLLPVAAAAVIFTVLTVGMVMVELPVDAMFLTGGGITLDQWLFRLFLRKRQRVIYTKYVKEEPKEDVC